MPYKGTIQGVDVIVTPDEPGYKLPEDMLLEPSFRANFNAWAAAFFKPKNPIDDDCVVTTPRAMHMNPRTYEKFVAGVEPILRYPARQPFEQLPFAELEMPPPPPRDTFRMRWW